VFAPTAYHAPSRQASCKLRASGLAIGFRGQSFSVTRTMLTYRIQTRSALWFPFRASLNHPLTCDPLLREISIWRVAEGHRRYEIGRLWFMPLGVCNLTVVNHAFDRPWPEGWLRDRCMSTVSVLISPHPHLPLLLSSTVHLRRSTLIEVTLSLRLLLLPSFVLGHQSYHLPSLALNTRCPAW
jgi:hypothetical protein